jgi:hypothetical protein
MQEAIFEVHSGGKVWRIYEDGSTDGFPTDSIIFNRIPARLVQMRALIRAADRVSAVIERGT